MEIKLLSVEYINSTGIFQDFINNCVGTSEEHYSGESIWIDQAPDFPIYMNVNINDRLEQYLNAFNAMSDFYLKTPRDIHMESTFWYTLFIMHKRTFLITNYPDISKDERAFRNIVLKKFDWENYIYKCVLAAQYISDNFKFKEERERYYKLIVNNLDLYNYIIKYEIFRNDKFLINVLDIVDEHNLSEILKSKIKGRKDLGEDERVGRRIIFELNKSYPVVLAPTLNKDELEIHFLKYLELYASPNKQSQTIEQQTTVKKKSGILGFFNEYFHE